MKHDRLEAILAERGPPPRSPTAEGLRLVLLDGVKVTVAARRVGISQPSLSRSVKRIRKYEENRMMTKEEYMELRALRGSVEVLHAAGLDSHSSRARLAELSQRIDSAPWYFCPEKGCLPRTVVGFIAGVSK